MKSTQSMALAALAAFAALSGCSFFAPTPPASKPRPLAAPPSTTASASTAQAAAVPTVPVPARLVALPAGSSTGVTSGATSGAAGGPTSGASVQCLAQIESFAELHSGNRVMLGQAAFANGGRLVLTRTPWRGPDGRPLDGRATPSRALVLVLLASPDGCQVRVADATQAATAGTVDASKSPREADEPRRSAPLPACNCVALSR